jgi:predicted nucleic acid-binding protein
MSATVCDSSTLIHLAGIGRLDLLRQFYRTVQIPPAVFREVVTEGGTRLGS